MSVGPFLYTPAVFSFFAADLDVKVCQALGMQSMLIMVHFCVADCAVGTSM